MNRIFSFLCLSSILIGGMSFSLTSNALVEDQSLQTLIGYMENGHKCDNSQEDFWKIKTLDVHKKMYTTPHRFNPLGSKLDSPEGTYKLRYSKYGCDLGSKGSIVVLPGRGESSVDFYETAIDLVARGYSPVYVLDHRGQGLSPRLIKDDLQKQHLVNYQHYITDMDQAVDDIQQDLNSLGRKLKKTPMYLLTNSMGGGIALFYFQMMNEMGKVHPFSAATLLSPTVRVNYLSYVKKLPTAFNRSLYSEFGALQQSRVFCLIPAKAPCGVYASNTFGDYVPTDFVLKGDASDQYYMTHSEARYNFHRYLFEDFDWSEIISNHYEEGENWNGTLIGGSTAGWVRASTPFFPILRSQEFIESLPKAKIMFMSGEFDHRIYRPYFAKDENGDFKRDENGDKIVEHDLKYHVDYCNDLNKFNSHGDSDMCKMVQVDGSFHEIHKEMDSIRNPALDKIDQFFIQNAK